MGRFGMGQAFRRVEDERLLTGHGRYTDDVSLAGQAYLYVYRSPYANGRIVAIETSAARRAPGVLEIFTGPDLKEAGVDDLPVMPTAETGEGASGMKTLKRPPLARDWIHYVGEPVAAIVAASPDEARDAAERIELEVEEAEAVGTLAAAVREGSSPAWPDRGDNRIGTMTHGDKKATDAMFAKAHRVVELHLVNNRLAPTAMEPRAALAEYEADSGNFTVHVGTQGVHSVRDSLAATFHVPKEKIRVVTSDVGGGFGPRLHLDVETVLTMHAARALGRPVKWTADRTESFLGDLHARDHLTHAALALNEDSKFLALRIITRGNVGAYTAPAGMFIPWFGTFMAPGCYAFQAAYAEVSTYLSNSSPVDAYRGAGRPEALYLIERLVDKAAREVGLAPDEIRRRNFIPPEAFPYKNAFGQVYDTGEYERVMEACMRRADWGGFTARRKASEKAGRLRGIGMSYYVEICAGFGNEISHLKFEKDGTLTLLVGTQSTGQGHETSFGQLIAGALGVDLRSIRVIQGDTARIATGGGTGGSRTMAIGGSAAIRAVDALIDAGKRTASELLEATASDIEFEPGVFRVAGTDLSISLPDVVAASFDDRRRPENVEPGLAVHASFKPEAGTFPNGCHICEVEIDPDTGETRIIRYTIEDDVGTVINPLLLEGQIVGGVAQGIGQAMMEQAVYDDESAQLLTATFMDYAMPRADGVPPIDFAYREVPSPRNPLGVKGAGEAGTIGAPPAVVNAVIDALSPFGIDHLDMPLTPLKVWLALQSGKTASSTAG